MMLVIRVLSLAALLCLVTAPVSVQAAVSEPNDVLALQFALTLEHLQADLYTRALATFTPTTPGANQAVYDTLNIIVGHERSQVAYLTTLLGNDATRSCTHTFGSAFLNFPIFMSTATVIENGVIAGYNSLINRMTNPTLAQVLTSMAGVQARHAAYLATALNASPFPAATDTISTPRTIYTAITSYIQSCPFDLSVVANVTIRPDGVSGINGTVVQTGPRRVTTPMPQYSPEQRDNDINILNYLNVVEYMAASLQNVTRFSATEFATAGYSQALYNRFSLIGQQEGTHSLMISSLLNGRGSTLIEGCQNFASLNTVQSYLAFIAIFERLTQEAYNSVISMTTDTQLQQLLATFNTVEARHSTFVNQLTNTTTGAGVGSPVTSARSPAQVLTDLLALVPFAQCSGYSTIAQPRVVLPAAIRGDPAFVGFHGQSFQVHGIDGDNFNLITSPTLQINSQFTYIGKHRSMTATQQRHARLRNKLAALPTTKAFDHVGTFLTAFGIKIATSTSAEHTIYVRAGAYTNGFGIVRLDGASLDVSGEHVNIDTNCYVSRPTSSILVIVTPVIRLTLVNSDHFINVEHAAVDDEWFSAWEISNASSDKSAQTHVMDGLLGQSINPAWTPSGSSAFREHQLLDYWVEGDIFSDKFSANRYLSKKK